MMYSTASARVSTYFVLGLWGVLSVGSGVHSFGTQFSIIDHNRCDSGPHHKRPRTCRRQMAETKTDSSAVVDDLTRTAATTEQRLSAFQILAGNMAQCLVMSDRKRDTGMDGASTGWTSWVDEKSSFTLQKCMDKLTLSVPVNPADPNDIQLLQKRDDAQRWTQWMKNAPAPMVIELTTEIRQAVSMYISDDDLAWIKSERDEFLERVGCRVMVLPSGKELEHSIRTPAGAMAFGKLLFGGVSRYRFIGAGKSRRKAGDRTVIYEKGVKSWLQYGGPERLFGAVDMGPCCILEVLLLPHGLSVPLLQGEEMAVSKFQWEPHLMLDFVEWQEDAQKVNETSPIPEDLVEGIASNRVEQLETSFQSTVGGLRPQIEEIVRRVLDGRVIRPLSELGNDDWSTHRVKEAEELIALGLQPVKGLLLYGPPGCGKTVLAREISNALDARPPKIVAAPELLDRWIGGSEKLVRDLFSEAELELRQCNGDPTKSALHVIVIDEIDAVFKKRSSAEDSGEVTRASAVNQILSKLDGVNALGNVLFIGMTNRKELLDDALVRPGRLEVQVEIPLPNQVGRREILQIHFESLRRKGRLSRPLCQAIDGTRVLAEVEEDVPNPFWRLRRAVPMLSSRRVNDLAAERWTGGFSGADLAGLVRCAGSLALSRARSDGAGVESLLITLEDVMAALVEVKR